MTPREMRASSGGHSKRSKLGHASVRNAWRGVGSETASAAPEARLDEGTKPGDPLGVLETSIHLEADRVAIEGSSCQELPEIRQWRSASI